MLKEILPKKLKFDEEEVEKNVKSLCEKGYLEYDSEKKKFYYIS